MGRITLSSIEQQLKELEEQQKIYNNKFKAIQQMMIKWKIQQNKTL